MRKIILFASVLFLFVGCTPAPTFQGEPSVYPASRPPPTAVETIRVQATKTPQPTGTKSPTIPMSSPSILFPGIPAGNGFIMDAGNNALLPSRYQVKNQWFIDLGEKKLLVIAGAMRSAHQGDQNFVQPWPGVLIIEVWDSNGIFLKEERAEYFTPVRVGAVQIVDAIGMKLYLLAEDETPFVFDVMAREYLFEEIPPEIILPTMPTPTQTSPSGPTSTALPTLNPYP